jgi:hypothetical protein
MRTRNQLLRNNVEGRLEEAVQQGIESLTFKPYEVKFLRRMFQ